MGHFAQLNDDDAELLVGGKGPGASSDASKNGYETSLKAGGLGLGHKKKKLS